MANEIIKIIEYITRSPFVQGAFLAYIVLGAILTAFVITVFAISLCRVFKELRRQEED